MLSGIFSSLVCDKQDFYFLAAGKTLENLEHAKIGHNQQAAMLKEMTEHLGATDIWPSGQEVFQSSGGFKVNFKSDAQPDGWYRPKEWGNRLTERDGSKTYLPEDGSKQQHFLFQQAEKIENICNAYGHQPSSGYSLYCWQENVYSKESVDVALTHIADDVYVILVCDLIGKDSPDYIPEGCLNISYSDKRMLEHNPSKAKARADNIRHGIGFLNLGAGMFDKFTI